MKCINNIILYIKYIRTNLKALSVSVGGAHLWNEVDSNLRNTKNILLFQHFKRGVLSTYIIMISLIGNLDV